MSPDTLLHVPPIIAGPLFALLFYWLSTALGSRLLRVLRAPASAFDIWEHGFIAATLGMASLQLVPCALAAVGRMTPGAVRIACAALALAMSPDMIRVARRALTEARSLFPTRLSTPAKVWLGLLVLVLGSLLLRASVLRSFGDDDGYHLSGPKRWLTAGTLSYLATYTHTNASLGFEMLYVIALSVTDVIGAKALHYGAGVFTLLGVFLASRRLGNPFAGAVTISLFLLRTPLMNLPVLFTVAYADFGAAWMAMASVLLFLIWRKERDSRILTCFALCAGCAGSFKFTCLALGVAWAPALIFEARQAGASWLKSFSLVVRFGAISVIPVVPWLIRNSIVTGNPLYPLLASLIPTRDWSAEHAKIFGRYVRYYSWGVAQGARLDDAARLHILLACGASIVIAGALGAWLIRRAVLRSLLVFSITFALISVALTGMIFRYWLPAALCGTLALTAGLTANWTAKWRFWPISALLVVALVRTLHIEPDDVFIKNAKIAAGVSTFGDEYPTDKAWLMWPYINHETPADARVLAASFYTSTGASSFGGFWSDRRFYVTDSHLQMFVRLQDWPSFLHSLREAHISHVLIFEKQLNPTRHGFVFPEEQNEYVFCRRLVDQYGKKLAQFGDLQLYEVQLEQAERDIQLSDPSAGAKN